MALISESRKSTTVFAERSVWTALLLWVVCVAAIIPLSRRRVAVSATHFERDAATSTGAAAIPVACSAAVADGRDVSAHAETDCAGHGSARTGGGDGGT